MPSDEMVEKVARAIPDEAVEAALEAHWRVVPIGAKDMASAMRAAIEAAIAALAAAEAVEPVAWRVHDWADGWILFDNEARAKHEADNSTGVIQPLFASPPSEASRDERALLDQFGKHPNWELSYAGGWTDDPAKWTVHEVTGGRNDRVWTTVGEGATPADAIATAIRARGES